MISAQWEQVVNEISSLGSPKHTDWILMGYLPLSLAQNPDRLGALSLAQSSMLYELIRNPVIRQSLQQISRDCLKVKPRGAATLEMENRFYVVSAQPREIGCALFPTGTGQKASSQRWLSGGNCVGLCV